MKIGIYGGTFNPPHLGHLILAEKAVELLKLNKLLLVPASIPPHKQKHNLISPYHRKNMLQISIKQHSFFEISDIEIEREGPSYTIDTIEILRQKYQHAKFYLLVGYDNFIEFHLWKQYEEIFRLCTVTVFKRAIQNIKHEIDYNLPVIHKIRYLNTPLLDISSTEIRERVIHGKAIDYYVTPAVKKYIEKNNLYR